MKRQETGNGSAEGGCGRKESRTTLEAIHAGKVEVQKRNSGVKEKEQRTRSQKEERSQEG
jgi:hypothetical protein